MRISDWSSDVGSSDLCGDCRRRPRGPPDSSEGVLLIPGPGTQRNGPCFVEGNITVPIDVVSLRAILRSTRRYFAWRSEERRVGNGCVSTVNSWWSLYH